MHNILFLIGNCLCTWFVYRDSRKTAINYRNLWIVGAFLLPIVFFPVYLIRRAQLQQQTKLSNRQLREMAKRKASEKRMQKAQKEKEQWEQQMWRQQRENAEKQRLIDSEQQKMRAELEKQLSTQQQRHADRWGIRKN